MSAMMMRTFQTLASFTLQLLTIFICSCIETVKDGDMSNWYKESLSFKKFLGASVSVLIKL